MQHYSPLRYPGGKSKLIPYVLETLKLNQLEGGIYVEPFAGGAAIAWYLLLNEHVERVYINDLNLSIHAFWYSVLNQTDELCRLIFDTPITMDEWHKQKSIQENEESSLLDRGFATFFLNRTNRSGIISGGAIGGLQQNGKYKLDCRFNKKRLVELIIEIASKREKVCLTGFDGIDFINEFLPLLEDKCLVNIDPPYYVKGKGLYQNFFEPEDHERLRNSVKYIRQPWIVTYDDTPEINDLYSEFRPTSFGLRYVAQVKRKGREVFVTSPRVKKCNYKPDVTFKELKKMSTSMAVNASC